MLVRCDMILPSPFPARTARQRLPHFGSVVREEDCNTLDAQQFGDEETGHFFLRVHFDPAGQCRAARTHYRAGSRFGDGLELHDARRRARRWCGWVSQAKALSQRSAQRAVDGGIPLSRSRETARSRPSLSRHCLLDPQ